jgi:hypothetical protein
MKFHGIQIYREIKDFKFDCNVRIREICSFYNPLQDPKMALLSTRCDSYRSLAIASAPSLRESCPSRLNFPEVLV